jgi:hypothetical protein
VAYHGEVEDRDNSLERELEDELAMGGGIMAVVVRALYPDISPTEASRLNRTLLWALDHPDDALAIISKAKEAGHRPVFPEPISSSTPPPR